MVPLCTKWPGRAMSREEDETETAESVLSKLLAGRSLLEVFTPRRKATALREELRCGPGTRAILDGSRLDKAPPAGQDETDQPPSTRSRGPASSPDGPTSVILRMGVEYTNGMTQEEIARQHGLHIQTVRKRLKVAGVVTRSRGTALIPQNPDEARDPPDAWLSAREVARRRGSAHTTLLRAIRRRGHGNGG